MFDFIDESDKTALFTTLLIEFCVYATNIKFELIQIGCKRTLLFRFGVDVNFYEFWVDFLSNKILLTMHFELIS